MTGNQDVPGRGHTISLNDNEPGTPIAAESPPQYMPDSPPEYSLVPGGAGKIFFVSIKSLSIVSLFVSLLLCFCWLHPIY